MKNWMFLIAGLVIGLLMIGAVGFTFGTYWLTTVYGEQSGPAPVRSDEGIDRTKCNWVHNIEACGGEVERKAKGDLAARLGVPERSITVRSRERVEWPDAGLGNPRADHMYAQVVTPGYQIVLEANGSAYEYHTDLRERVEFVGQR